ncbi:MAG: TonB-dependent receptor plug domain-containing protein [Mangrovibacterium sp.]
MQLRKNRSQSNLNKLIVSTFLVLISTFSWGNDHREVAVLKGKIVDENKQALPFTSVCLLEIKRATMTNEEGYFVLKAPEGEYTLVANHIGFETVEKTLKLKANSPNYITIAMSKQTNDLDEVQVRGERKSEALMKSGFAVTSIDTRHYQSKSTEINDILDKVPGLRVRRDGGLGSKTSYNINGLSGRAVRIFIDGVPAESFGSSYSINSIPVSIIERIDVYKGVVPVEFGNDAMGGVINIVTKQMHRGMKDKTLAVSYSYGSFNTHRADLSGSWREKKTGITTRLSTFYNYSDNDYEVWSDDIKVKDYTEFLSDGSRNPDYLTVVDEGVRVKRFNDAYYSYGGKLDFGFTKRKWTDQLFFSLNLSKDYKESQHGPRMITPYGERFSKGWTVAPSMSYSKRSFLFRQLDVAAHVQYSKAQRALVDTTTNRYDWFGKLLPQVSGVNRLAGESGTASLNVDDSRNIISNLSLAYRINDNNRVALNYTNNSFIRSSDDELREAEERNYGSENVVNKQITGLTFQHVSANEKIRASIFGKYYQTLLEQDKVQFNKSVLDTISSSRPDNDWGLGGTLSYAPSSRVRINSSIERAVRLVSVNEVFGNVAEEIVESVDLESEKSFNVNLGGVFTFYRQKDSELSLTSNLFFRNTTDKIRRSVVVRNDDSYSVFNNIGHIISKGVEAQFDYRLNRKWSFMLQGYYLDSRYMERYALNGSENLNYKSREPNMPWLTASFSAEYAHRNLFRNGDVLNMSWFASYVHEFHFDWDVIGNQNKPIVPTQLRHDASMSYTFPNRRITISLDASNLFDAMVFDNYAIQKPGRAIYGKLRYEIF